ncbi:MAG: adenylosuccinate lyase [Clostridiales bacterium]|nr:adenylosuccinate lyase [Clostridiales bacterium]
MNDAYENVLSSRYAGEQMLRLFSPDHKFRTWRRLWIALAESEMELGLPITVEQIEEMKRFSDEINYDEAREAEKRVRHDVMAHVHAYGVQCPKAKPIIHLGATSCYVGDNTDILIMRQALLLVRSRLIRIIDALRKFAEEYKNLPTLGFTHFQPAQLVTVGKRATLWIQDLLFDVEDIDFVYDGLKLLGCKGTTGTQASFLSLFDGDHGKVEELDRLIASKMSVPDTYPVSGQTYSRKIDSRVVTTLSSIAQSASKFSNDIRLLQHLKEVEEPFEKDQIGSSAMAYKRNPMRSERMASLSRYVISQSINPPLTASAQWFERTLDDSANKRLCIAESFLATDAILIIYENVASGLCVNQQVIHRRIMEELPFMATENILMESVKRGGDRQALHERIRVHSMAAATEVKSFGRPNDLLDRIADDESFDLSFNDLNSLLDPSLYIGRCPEQVDRFLKEFVYPLLAASKDDLAAECPELKV